jgi:FtsZ-binding cell division protein ZapB
MSKMPQAPTLELFAVRSAAGQYLRSKGYSGHGKNWVDDLSSARIYTKVGHARAQATWWLQNYPEHGAPEVVVLEARIAGTTKTKVCDKLAKEHAKALDAIAVLDSEIEELELTISESDSDVVRKCLGHQVENLRAKRTLADKQAASLHNRVSKMSAAMRSREFQDDEVED